jgi:hypothetical protein
MTNRRHAAIHHRGGIAVVLACCLTASAQAQTVEISPFAGYRFGGDLFELATNRPLDIDGSPVVGAVVNVEMGEGLWFEAVFSHQHADVHVASDALRTPARWRLVTDHWLAGGRQEFGAGRAQPFLSGLLGLTRYGAEGDDEIRFTIGTGGGVKLAIQDRLGLRLDSRVFSTFVDADARAVACAPGGCFFGLNVSVVWQIEFTAEVVVVF